MADVPEVTRQQRLRIVILICCSFGRNLAYYRAWRGEEHQYFLSLASNHPIFWRAVNNNFFDMCVLEWCKLFADKQGKHGWRTIVTDPPKFEADLLSHLGLDTTTFENKILYRTLF